MPRAPQVCAVPGCPKLRPCPTHRPRPTAAARGYDAKWRRTRGRYLQLHPMCEHAGCVSLAEDVHHLDGLGPLGPQGHAHANLQALCHPHHSSITARTTNGRRT
jgi:5-methylcytosine-specific restriction protein A